MISISVTPSAAAPAGIQKQDGDDESAEEAGEDDAADDEEAAAEAAMRSRVSVGGTIRHNVSTANLLSDSQHAELMEWATRENGPWSEDIREFPGPDRESIVAGGAGPEGEPYRPTLSGFSCELTRNEYLAWCGTVQLPPEHPDYSRRPNHLLSGESPIRVHGGLTTTADDSRGRFMFDCNHGSTDLVPYASFVGAKNDVRRVGTALAAQLAPAGRGGPDVSGDSPTKKGLLLPPGASGGGGTLRPPVAGPASAQSGVASITVPMANRGATYKDYHFARRELESLAAQFRARAGA